ncbi:MAG: threonine/serine dehydratase [Pseudomonadota bacterium]|nr:threonine/serine dehydratase [Pseudomonadota bacterium]
MPTVTIDDVRAAAGRLKGIAAETPLLESARLNERLGARLLVKPECLQRTGSFKFRGAYNRLAAMDPAERARGVLAYSSGNHAQGVALAARLFGVPATIIMPSNAPQMKRANTAEYGATVILYDRERENREEIGARIAEEQGLTLVRPYDDPWVIAGQGTVGLEAASQCRAVGASPDVALAPAGGGGLIAGFSTAIRDAFPACEVYAAEPEEFDDTGRSLAAGTHQSVVAGASSICDAILTPTPGQITFAINRETLAGGVAVSDDEVLAAMATAFRELKIVAEPGGSVALAAVLAGKVPVAGRTLLVVVSGGNVDAGMFRAALDLAA